MHKGKVFLVGAGPGDAGLLTVKAAKLLQKADTVVYDRLVGSQILNTIPDKTEKIYVGKNAGFHLIAQEKINDILLQKALENKIVVRLKGGDPFLFGRGGEELQFLLDNNIAFEVVPGVTSAIAAPAYAGIPVTHRDFCSSLHIISGHGKKNSDVFIDYESLVKLNGTLVFMMSVNTVGIIANGLITAGMDKHKCIAIIENGTTKKQRKFIGELANIADIIKENNVISPSAIIVGDVCTMSDKLDWFSKLPLNGCRILVTRPKRVAGKLSKILDELGAQTIELPCIETKLIDIKPDIQNFDWLIFTSEVGVISFFTALFKHNFDSRFLYSKKIAAVGTETATALATYGITADFIPTIFDGVHLATELIASGKILKNENIGLFRSKIGANEILEIFKNNNITVTDIPVYETHFLEHKDIDLNDFDFVTFTSASCVDGFVNCFVNTDFSHVNAVCIGEQTAKNAKKFGMNILKSQTATISSIVDKIMEAKL